MAVAFTKKTTTGFRYLKTVSRKELMGVTLLSISLIAAFASIIYGLWLMYPPAAFVVAGALWIFIVIYCMVEYQRRKAMNAYNSKVH